MSAPKKLETLGDVLRRDYKRRWRKANPDKVRQHYQAAKVRAYERYVAQLSITEARAQP